MFTDKEIFNLKPSKEILDLQQNVVESLKPKHREKIKELRSRVEGLLKPTHNDFFLLKWLRARKFDVSAAEVMLKSNIKWRKEWRADYIHEEFELPKTLLKYFPFGYGGEDKDGCPVIIVASGNFDIRGAMYTVQKSDFIKFNIYFLEYLEKITIQLSEKYKKLITGVNLISDADNFKFQDFVWKPAFDMNAVFQQQILEPNYPEFLKRLFVVNAPKVFEIFFGMVKPFLSEDTKSKMQIFGKNGWKEALLEIIDPDQLPKHWGGNLVNEEDGSPYGPVGMGGPIPKSCYKTLKIDKSKMNSVSIPSRGKLKADIEIKSPGSVLSWEFQTEDHDIGFDLSLKRQDNERNNNSNFEDEVVMPWLKANCHLVPEDGKWNCKEMGTYTITFDNSYSWYRSKNLMYYIQVSTPDSTIKEIKLCNEE